MNTVYNKRNFQVYHVEKDEFIVHNTNKVFSLGHTHLKGFESSRYLINLAIHKSIPYNLDDYRIRSLIRISEDTDYISKLKELLDIKRNRRCSAGNYYNRRECRYQKR